MAVSKGGSDEPEWLAGDAEARRHQREAPLGIVLRNPVAGEVLDISTSGMGLEAAASLIPLSRRKFTLGIGEARATVLGEVRWCRLAGMKTTDSGESAPLYRAGVALLEPIVLS